MSGPCCRAGAGLGAWGPGLDDGECRLRPADPLVFTFGDGLEIDGDILYVVRNQLNEIAVVDLGPRLRRGAVVAHLTDDDFDIPTTVALLGDSLYAVNARFGTAGPQPAEYWITRIDAFDEDDEDD